MDIAWLADFDASTHPGGAQITNSIMIEHAPEHVEITSYNREQFDQLTVSNYDLFVLNDIHYLPEDALSSIMQTGQYIKYEHAWQGLDVFKERQPDLYRESLLNIFLSPLARQAYEAHDMIDSDPAHNAVVPSPLEGDFQRQIPDSQRRPENIALYTGELSEHKLSGLFEWIDNEQSDLIVEVYGFDHGYLENIERHDQFRYMGYVSHAELPVIYNQYRKFVHHPQLEPFGRSVAEAYLCGCELVCNDRIGFLSFDWDFGNYPEIRQTLTQEPPNWFWTEIKQAVDGV